VANQKTALPVLNLSEATFECIYGRGCDGICCRNGRPPVSAAEQERIDANLDKLLPLLSARQRQAVEQDGYLSRRIKSGKPMLRVLDGWCIFFHEGCVLHKAGMQEGDKFRYKPAPCSLFPLERDDDGAWYVRQHGYKGEKWDLFCLAPGQSAVPAEAALQEELAFVRRRMEAEQAGS
jgi:hypothetical protein